MNNIIAGIDTVELVTQKHIDRARVLLGKQPQFWGRYFLGSDAEYIHTREDTVLAKNNIRLVPICRETRKVMGDYDCGHLIGANVAQDILDTFTEEYLSGKSIYIFLDTEPRPEPAMTVEYYTGWSTGVKSVSKLVTFLPCVYMNIGDDEVQNNLNTSISNGAKCHGLWVASYGNNQPLISDWSDIKLAVSVDVPVLIHQYAGDIDKGVFDCNKLNPAYLDTINHFIVTPKN